ncbi:hypothetical protein [Paracoccus sp. (in: a-proteobacteria)]|uniref:hypothetical protein n=1 Tax=Paracoccus sp. TaxID=267 RepID=UPI003A8B24BC
MRWYAVQIATFLLTSGAAFALSVLPGLKGMTRAGGRLWIDRRATPGQIDQIRLNIADVWNGQSAPDWAR